MQVSETPNQVQVSSREVSQPITKPAALHLHRIATVFSRLSPLFARLRSMPDFGGNTLLPNAVSPIAPAMAYGFCGDLDHGAARRRLENQPEWKRGSTELAKAYEAYKEESGNALMWAGWNYWDPTRAESSDRRVIQVVLTEDLLQQNGDLLDRDRPLLEHDGKPLLTVGDFQDPPDPMAPSQVPLGSHISNDVGLVPENLVNARLFLHNVWRDVFVPSVRDFNQPGSATIVDHLLHEHEAYGKMPNMPSVQDFMAIFDADGMVTENCQIEGMRQFFCIREWAESLWSEVSTEFQKIHGAARSGDQRSLTTSLLQAWQDLSESKTLLGGRLAQPLNELCAALGEHVQTKRLAYVIFQHLALFDRFLLSPNQYVFPLVYGRHLFVAFLAMKNPLNQSDAEGWRQIVSSLFGSLLVELLSQKYTQMQVEMQVEEERRQRADEQRLMLSHSLPKSVFKPAEYFTVRLHGELAKSLMERKNFETRTPTANLMRMAESILLLLQKGQAEISDYAQGQTWEQIGAAEIDIYEHYCPV